MQKTILMKIIEQQEQLSVNPNLTDEEKARIFYEYVAENKDLFLEMDKANFKFAFIEGSIQRNFSETNDEVSLADHWFNCKFLKK